MLKIQYKILFIILSVLSLEMYAAVNDEDKQTMDNKMMTEHNLNVKEEGERCTPYPMCQIWGINSAELQLNSTEDFKARLQQISFEDDLQSKFE